MSAKSFVAITSEGGMLPVDFLQELVSPRTAVEGLTPASYHLAEGERISEQVNRSWNRLKGCWANFRKATADKNPGDPTTSETRERWLQPLFQELGFGQKLPSAKPIEIEGRLYPVSHGWGSVPMHLVGSHVDIDRRTPGAIGAAKASPHSLVQQTLNASDNHLWGIVSNGLVLRLLRDNVTLTRMAYLEWDLAAIFDGDLYSEFFLLWLLCHQSRFEGERPDQCWLEKWKKEAADKSFRALEDLRPGVEKAISSLGEGLMSHPANKELLTKLQSGALDKQEFYRQILRVVYRMIFLFAAEDRGLLHPPLPENDSDAEAAALKARQRYQDFYSLSRLRQRSMYRTGTPHPDLWVSFQLVTRKLGSDAGSPELALPPLGSFLWQSDRSTPDLNGCLISNRHFLRAVQSLAFVKGDGVRRSVDYRNLGAEEIGAVYEGLLELHPNVNADLGTFELDTAAGNERKTSGSYYTPDSLVQCLLDTALDPVIDQAASGKSGEKAAEAILRLKVCDPAVGSGHFLIAAAHRMARRVAAARTGEEEPSPEASRAALRDVIGRCLYGVDINPMSAELCRVSLWLEALQPGKPLSFLDHHIKVGNSLLGATPKAIEEGIPDGAFKPIAGDDPEFCKAAKKQNKEERSGQRQLFHGSEAGTSNNLAGLCLAIQEVETLDDATLEAVHAKKERYEKLITSDNYANNQLIADAWCAAFVMKKRKPHDGGPEYAITAEVFRKIERNPRECALWMRSEIDRLRNRYQFFHWHLAFPEVFPVPESRQSLTNKHAGWDGGFDVMLGNPPWERPKPEPAKYFAASRPDIAEAQTSAVRDRLLAKLKAEEPEVFAKWAEYERFVLACVHFQTGSGMFPLSAVGKFNLGNTFVERSRQLLCAHGRCGVMNVSGLATDDSGKDLIADLMRTETLVSFYDFENRQGLFPAIHRSYKFSAITVAGSAAGGASAADFVFFAQSVDDLNDVERHIAFSADDIHLLNPISGNCPIFRNRRQAELVKAIYRRAQLRKPPNEVLWEWDAEPTFLFVMSDHSDLFATREELGLTDFTVANIAPDIEGEKRQPLYESKMFHQFEHRWSSIDTEGSQHDLDSIALANPACVAVPRYWMRASDAARKLCEIPHEWLIAVREVTNSTNERTTIASILPKYPVGHNAQVFAFRPSSREATCFVACLNSLVLDFAARTKVGGSHLSSFILRQLPILPSQHFSGVFVWAGGGNATLNDWILPRVIELTYTAWDLELFAKDCEWDGPPFRWDEDRRFLLQCELDAAYFHLYGLNRDDTAYILDTFPIVKRKDEEKYGTYRTKDTILEIYDELQAAMDSKQPYQTRLDPPPGPPIDRDGKFVHYEDIASNPPPHIHLPRNAKPANNEWQLTDLAREFPRSPFKLRSNAADGPVVNVQPVSPNTVNSGDHVVVAHPELRRGQDRLAAVTGRIVSIANRQDASSNESFIHLAIQGANGITELRLPTEEWNRCESIGIIKSS